MSTKADNDQNTKESINILRENGFQVEIIKDLHSKAVIGPNLMYEGSANITQNGLYKNIESINILTVENQEFELRRILK